MRVRLKTDEPAPPVLWFTFAAIFLLGGAIEIVTRRQVGSGVLYCCIGLSYMLDIAKPRLAQVLFGLSLASLLTLGITQLMRGSIGMGALNTGLAAIFLILLVQRVRSERAAAPPAAAPTVDASTNSL
ncbi:MAG TPA: hypothetical protein VFA04_08090 [Bryobacteraceae bacterium]|nr:hypothetical protein [Bryobacteraceae bacterium]